MIKMKDKELRKVLAETGILTNGEYTGEQHLHPWAENLVATVKILEADKKRLSLGVSKVFMALDCERAKVKTLTEVSLMQTEAIKELQEKLQVLCEYLQIRIEKTEAKWEVK